MLRYYITDRRSAKLDVLVLVERAVSEGIEMIQIREKDLGAGALFDLTRRAVRMAQGTSTRVLVNDRIDVAIAAGAHGAHLRSSSVPVDRVRRMAPEGFLIGVSCHTAEEVVEADEADFVVLSPVFAKPGYAPPLGLDAFGVIARTAKIPVLALGGVTEENAPACVAAGAAGIAGIAMFQDRWSA